MTEGVTGASKLLSMLIFFELIEKATGNLRLCLKLPILLATETSRAEIILHHFMDTPVSLSNR